MSNVNTLAHQDSGVFYPQTAPLGNASSETAFTLNTNAVVSGLGGTTKAAIIRLTPAVNYDGSGSIWDQGKRFAVRGAGRVTGGTTTNFTLKLYQVPSAIVTAATAATLSNDNGIAASTARAVNSTTAVFSFDVEMQWDSVGQKLYGTARFFINGLLDSSAAFTSLAISPNADTELNFLVSGLFSASNANNTALLTEFYVDQL